MLKGTDNSLGFLVVDLLVALCRAMLGREEGHRVEDPVLTVLGQDTCGDVVGGIGLNDDVAIKVEVSLDRCRSELSFQFLESVLLVLVSIETLVFPGEFYEWPEGGGKAVDKTTVEVGKPKERSDIHKVAGGPSLPDSLDLLWLHAYSPTSDDEA